MAYPMAYPMSYADALCARAYSLVGEYQRAAEQAMEAVRLRPGDVNWVTTSEDLKGLRSSPFFECLEEEVNSRRATRRTRREGPFEGKGTAP